MLSRVCDLGGWPWTLPLGIKPFMLTGVFQRFFHYNVGSDVQTKWLSCFVDLHGLSHNRFMSSNVLQPHILSPHRPPRFTLGLWMANPRMFCLLQDEDSVATAPHCWPHCTHSQLSHNECTGSAMSLGEGTTRERTSQSLSYAVPRLRRWSR